MKVPRFVGQMFALCLPGLVALTPAIQRQPVETRIPRPEPTGSASVRHKDGSHYRVAADLGAVREVRSLVEHALRLRQPGLDTHARARAALSERYGGRLSETSTLIGYAWVWVNDRWVLVCSSTATFEVDFGRWGKVLVETQEEMDAY